MLARCVIGKENNRLTGFRELSPLFMWRDLDPVRFKDGSSVTKPGSKS